MRYGEPGPGRWITIYARNGHVFMTLCGLRLDTGGHAGYRRKRPALVPEFAGYQRLCHAPPAGILKPGAMIDVNGQLFQVLRHKGHGRLVHAKERDIPSPCFPGSL